jgi:hypothetical protein
LDRLSGKIGRTFLVKLAYLADHEARRFLGRPLTAFEYRVDNYGPFDPQFFATLDEMAAEGEIVEQHVIFPTGKPGFRLHSTGLRQASEFTAAEQAVLSYILGQNGESRLDDLLESVYQTEPFVKAQAQGRGTALPMDELNDAGIVELGGVRLEDAIAGHAAAVAGRLVDLEDWAAGLPREAE